MIPSSLSPVPHTGTDLQGLLTSADRACSRIPPLWPMDSFVAVNPFLGLADRPFPEVCDLIPRVAHGSMLMGPGYFQARLAEGAIGDPDLREAIERSTSSLSLEDLHAWLRESDAWCGPGLETVADVADRMGLRPWRGLAEQEIGKWCAAYLDEAHSVWPLPWRGLPLFAAWRQTAQVDASPEIEGLSGFREWVGTLDENPDRVLGTLLGRLELDLQSREDYLHRLLLQLPGWSGHLRYREWTGDTGRMGPHPLRSLLAIRLAYEVAMLREVDSPAFREFWTTSAPGPSARARRSLECAGIWQLAAEIAFQRRLLGSLGSGASGSRMEGRPDLHAVFCIDVRSEGIRRALEAQSPGIQTLGFAGFFGMPIACVREDDRRPAAHVPALLRPRFQIVDAGPDRRATEGSGQPGGPELGRRLQEAWSEFKAAGIGGFGFIEALGGTFGWDLLRDGFHQPRRNRGHSRDAGPLSLDPCCNGSGAHAAGVQRGIPVGDRIPLAATILKHIGLAGTPARIVLLCGHGSTTFNNPYAAALHCGACGGHAGDVNARAAAALLNDPATRSGLAERGILLPADTWFLPAVHDTTSDELVLLEEESVPPSHRGDLERLRHWIGSAGELARDRRARTLGLGGLSGQELETALKDRGRDWSQVRPEWGLAGNAAFVAARRDRTRHLDLEGRAFLHEYRAESDPTLETLELILTAPVVVASWINLQYYASTVNQRLWGSGSKITHNIVGGFGVQQGNDGDLRMGLPFQSVHDGDRWRHEPLRLSVILETDPAKVDVILGRQPQVLELVRNGWIHLFTIAPDGSGSHYRTPGGGWQPHPGVEPRSSGLAGPAPLRPLP